MLFPDNDIGAAGAESLGKALETCKLLELDLSRQHRAFRCYPWNKSHIWITSTENAIGDRGMIALAQGLMRNKTLGTLNLESE